MRLFIFGVFYLSFFQFSLAQPQFAEEASLLGLGETCGTTYLGNGISFVDYNNDGWDDITLTTSVTQNLRFFKNTNGTFSEEFLNIPLAIYQTKQVNWVDFDNDGDRDLFVTSDYEGNRLLENDGNFNFQDVTISAGLPTANMFSYGASWGDIDNDGLLDIFISNRDATYANTNKLYKNNGNGTFSDISVSAGVALSTLSFCSAFLDYNNDGYQDIYISNDKTYTSNVLYKNNGDGTFDDVSQISQTDLFFDAMTVTVDDSNNDGWLDIYVTNGPAGNALLKNNGDGTFTDIADTSGTLFNSIGWGAVFFDAENDMDLDLYVSGSVDGSNPNYISAAFYQNIGVDQFLLSNNLGFGDDQGNSYSNAIGDVDNDGLMEVIVSNSQDEDLYLWNNKTITSNNWLKIKLEGTVSNRDGVGSKIELSTNGIKQYGYTLCGEGYLSQNTYTEHFGLGVNTVVDYVKVTWLSGIEDYYYHVSANQLLELTEGNGTLNVGQNDLNQIRLFPNPVNDILEIDTPENIKGYKIYDAFGKEVLTSQNESSSTKINLSSFSSGLYFIKIWTQSHFITKKIIKK